MIGDIYRVEDKFWAVQTKQKDGDSGSYAAFSIVVSEIEKEDMRIPRGVVDPDAECGLILGLRILAKRVRPSILKRTGRNVGLYLPIISNIWNTLQDSVTTFGFDYNLRPGRNELYNYVYKISKDMGW